MKWLLFFVGKIGNILHMNMFVRRGKVGELNKIGTLGFVFLATENQNYFDQNEKDHFQGPVLIIVFRGKISASCNYHDQTQSTNNYRQGNSGSHVSFSKKATLCTQPSSLDLPHLIFERQTLIFCFVNGTEPCPG